jgi:hypothetical protein
LLRAEDEPGRELTERNESCRHLSLRAEMHGRCQSAEDELHEDVFGAPFSAVPGISFMALVGSGGYSGNISARKTVGIGG